MKRAHVHLLLDVSLAIGAIALLWTGLLLVAVLPAGSRQAQVWGLTRHEWGDAHFWIAMVMVALLLMHLALNWNWVCTVVLKLCGRSPKAGQGGGRLWVGLTVLALLATIFWGSLWIAGVTKHDDPGPPRDGRGQSISSYRR